MRNKTSDPRRFPPSVTLVVERRSATYATYLKHDGDNPPSPHFAYHPHSPLFTNLKVTLNTMPSPHSPISQPPYCQLASTIRAALRLPPAVATGIQLTRRAQAYIELFGAFLDNPRSGQGPTAHEVNEMVAIKRALKKNNKLLQELGHTPHHLLAAAVAGNDDAAAAIHRIAQGMNAVRGQLEPDGDQRKVLVFGI